MVMKRYQACIYCMEKLVEKKSACVVKIIQTDAYPIMMHLRVSTRIFTKLNVTELIHIVVKIEHHAHELKKKLSSREFKANIEIVCKL